MLNADGYINWNWTSAFIPLYITIGIIHIAVIATVFLMTCHRYWYRRHSFLGSEIDIFRVVICIITVFILIPVTVFVGLLGPFLDGTIDITYTTLFGPLYVPFSGFIVAYVVMYCLFL